MTNMELLEKINNIKIWHSYVSKEKVFFAKNIPLQKMDYEYYELSSVLINLKENEVVEITSKTYNKIEQIQLRLKDLEKSFINLNKILPEMLIFFLCSDVPNAYYVFSPLKNFDSFLNQNNLRSVELILRNKDKSKFIYGSFPLQYLDNLTNSLINYNVNVFGYYFINEEMIFLGYENNFIEQFNIDSLNNFYYYLEVFDFNKLRILFEKQNTKKLFNTGFTNQSFYTNHDTFKSLVGANLKSNFNPSDIINYNLKYCSGNISINSKKYNIGVSQNSKIWFMTQPTKFFTKFNNLKAIAQHVSNKNNHTNNNFFHESKRITNIKSIVNCFLNYKKIYDGKPKTKSELKLIDFLDDLQSIKYIKSKNKVIIAATSIKIIIEIFFKKEIIIKSIVLNNSGLSTSFIEKKLIKYLVFLDSSYRKIDNSGFYYINTLSSLPMYNQINMNTSSNVKEEKPLLKNIIRYYNNKEIIDERKTYGHYLPTNQPDNTFDAFILYLYHNYQNHDYHLFCLDTHQSGGNWKGNVPFSLNPIEEVKAKEIADLIYIEEINKQNPDFINKTINTQLIGEKIYYINFIHCKGDKRKHQSPNELNKVIGQLVNSIIYTDFKNREELKKQLLGFNYQFNIGQYFNNNLINILNDICEPQNQVVFEISICFPNYDLSNNHDYSQQLHSFLHECQNILSNNNIYFSFYY